MLDKQTMEQLKFDENVIGRNVTMSAMTIAAIQL